MLINIYMLVDNLGHISKLSLLSETKENVEGKGFCILFNFATD